MAYQPRVAQRALVQLAKQRAALGVGWDVPLHEVKRPKGMPTRCYERRLRIAAKNELILARYFGLMDGDK